jgi:hypothetical protein
MDAAKKLPPPLPVVELTDEDFDLVEDDEELMEVEESELEEVSAVLKSDIREIMKAPPPVKPPRPAPPPPKNTSRKMATVVQINQNKKSKLIIPPPLPPPPTSSAPTSSASALLRMPPPPPLPKFVLPEHEEPVTEATRPSFTLIKENKSTTKKNEPVRVKIASPKLAPQKKSTLAPTPKSAPKPEAKNIMSTPSPDTIKSASEKVNGKTFGNPMKKEQQEQTIKYKELNTEEKYKKIHELPDAATALRLISDCQMIFEQNKAMEPYFLDILLNKGIENIKILMVAWTIYGNDMNKFKIFADLALHGSSTQLLSLKKTLEKIKASDPAIAIDVPLISKISEVIKQHGYEAGAAISAVRLEVFDKEIFDIYLKVMRENGIKAGDTFVRAIRTFGSHNPLKALILSEIVHSKGSEAVEALIKANKIIGSDAGKFHIFADIAKEYGGHHCLTLVAMAPLYNKELGMLNKLADKIKGSTKEQRDELIKTSKLTYEFLGKVDEEKFSLPFDDDELPKEDDWTIPHLKG